MLSPNNSVLIRPATRGDVSEVYRVSVRGMSKILAPKREAFEHLIGIFPDGLRVARLPDKRLAGFVMGLRWNGERIERDMQVPSFPDNHSSSGKNFFIKMILVDEKYAGGLVGPKLLLSLRDYAEREGIVKIQGVSWFKRDNYEKLGVREVCRVAPLWFLRPFMKGARMYEYVLAKS